MHAFNMKLFGAPSFVRPFALSWGSEIHIIIIISGYAWGPYITVGGRGRGGHIAPTPDTGPILGVT